MSFPRTTVLLVLLGAAATIPVARAEDPEPAPASGEELKVENGAFVIEGKIQKPQVVVVLRREALAEGISIELKESFLHRIVDATTEAPF